MAEVTDETYAAEPATTPRLPDAPPIRRTFSPGDVPRVLSGLLLLGLGVLFATVAENTISGIESDVIDAVGRLPDRVEAVSYTHLTLPTIPRWCSSRGSPEH